MHVLVTGGAGYIGGAVVEMLLERGHGVVVYDNLSRGHADAVPPGVPLVTADLLDVDTLGTTLRRHRIDAVVHMAASSLVGESMQRPDLYYGNNVVTSIALLDTLRDAGVARFVLSSTAAVYGEPAKQPIEEHDPTAPTNPYGETKLTLERALSWYGGAFGLASISLRYFNAAGATAGAGERHDPETHLIPLVLQAAAGTRPIVTIFGDDYPTRDGTCVRDYIHVRDLAQAHVLAVEALRPGDPLRVYNLGCGGDGYTVREVIDVAERVTGRRVPVTVGARRPGDPATLIASSDLIVRDLGWRPTHQDLPTIIDSAWRFMQRPPRSG